MSMNGSLNHSAYSDSHTSDTFCAWVTEEGGALYHLDGQIKRKSFTPVAVPLRTLFFLSLYTICLASILSMIFVYVCFLITPVLVLTKSVVISNVLPRLDTNGSYVDAHDGCLVKFNDTYFMYGTVYGNCHQSSTICDGVCGYLNNTFSLYISSDLVNWTLVSKNVVPEVTRDHNYINYWMPNVGYNRRTNQYVMTYWSSRYGFTNSTVAVAVSATPFGPFINVSPLVMQGAKVISSTIGLFVDDDNTAYVRYNTRDSPLRHVLEKLSPDWMTSTGQFSVIYEKQDYPWLEGGGMFKRNGIYYTMLGVDCCFCQWGADARTFISTDPLGNWTFLTQLNYCADGTAPSDHVDGMNINPCSMDDPYGTNFTVPAQQFNVAILPISANETLYLYYGERFRSSPDGIKGHDFQAWIPIEFANNDVPKPMKFYSNFTINIQERYNTDLFS